MTFSSDIECKIEDELRYIQEVIDLAYGPELTLIQARILSQNCCESLRRVAESVESEHSVIGNQDVSDLKRFRWLSKYELPYKLEFIPSTVPLTRVEVPELGVNFGWHIDHPVLVENYFIDLEDLVDALIKIS